ncbi:MAG: hypothetical protein D6784_04440 [Chloroflexi bacterium]|nr:MAG: hypothetical protein D6784_04440 [Chloroflexota bacterium]
MNIFFIARRDLAAMLGRPALYLITAFFLLATGLFFYLTLSIDRTATLSRVFLGAAVVLLFVAPVLTMRLLSEEARSGTLELILTAPVRTWELVAGKFLAAWAGFGLMLAPTVVYLLLLVYLDRPDIPVILSGYLGLMLVAALLLSFGLLASAVSSSAAASAALGILFSAGAWVLGGLTLVSDNGIGRFLRYLAIQSHFVDFLDGLISLNNVVYFFSGTFFALYLTVQLLHYRRQV